MNHLTDEQLTALRDGALTARERADAEAHVAGCDACRARLADVETLDEALERALEHDPGEAYFESFADRVAARIAAEGSGARAGSADARKPARSFWSWLLTPRGLSLAGSTAALLLVASLAWIRFGSRESGFAELSSRAPSPVGSSVQEQATPAPQQTLSEPAPAVAPDAELPEPQPGAPSGPGAQATRAREVRRNEAGEDVPVSGGPVRVAAPAAGTTSTLGKMKRHAVTPATEQSPAPAAAPSSAIAPLTTSAPVPTPPPAATSRASGTASNEAPQAKAAAPASEAQARDAKEQDTGAALPSCGSVRDFRGRAIPGARITVVNDVSRTSRSGPDGSFCLPRVLAGDVLSVLCVGYEPVRITVSSAAALVIALEPVGTLGPEVSKTLVPQGEPSATRQAPAPESGVRSFMAVPPSAPAPAVAPSMPAPSPDVYASQSAEARRAAAAARDAEGVARRENSAAAMDSAAVRWDRVTALATGAALHDARFRALSLRRSSMSAGPTPERVAKFREGLAVYLAQAPRGTPEYSTALRWQSDFQRSNKSLYR